MIHTRALVAVLAALPAILPSRSDAQDIPPHLTPEEMARLRRLLEAQERAEPRTPAMIERIREQLRNGARRG